MLLRKKYWQVDRKTYVLGSGQPRRTGRGIVNVDLKPWAGVDIVHDLEETPWPIPDGAAMHCNATHVAEHIRNFSGFMDECHRILSPGGSLFMEVPNARNADMAFADPTHVRFFTKHTFINYLTIEGVHRHGIFQHAWCMLHLEETDKVIRVHLAPVPDEYRTAESIELWKKYKHEDSHG